MEKVIKHSLIQILEKFPYIKYATLLTTKNDNNSELNVRNFLISCNMRLNYELNYLLNFIEIIDNDKNNRDYRIIDFICHVFIIENIIKTWYLKLINKSNKDWNSYINGKKIFSSNFSLYKEITFVKKNTDLLSFIRSMVFAHPMNYDRKLEKYEDLHWCSSVHYIDGFLRYSGIVKKYNKKVNVMIQLSKNSGIKSFTSKYICFSIEDLYCYIQKMFRLIWSKQTKEILSELNDETKRKMIKFEILIDDKNKQKTISKFIKIIKNKNIFDEYDNLILNELYILKFIFSKSTKFRIDFLNYLWNKFLQIINLAKKDILKIDFNDKLNISYKLLGLHNVLDLFEKEDKHKNYRIEKYHHFVEKAIDEIKSNKYCEKLNKINYSFEERDKIEDYDYAKTLLHPYKCIFAKSFNSKSYAEFHAYLLQDIYLIKHKIKTFQKKLI